MAPHLGLQRIMIPSAQVSSLTTGSITLPSARGTYVEGNFEAIQTVALTSAQSSISFTSIPQTYKHLQIRGILKWDYSSNSSPDTSAVGVRFNGDSGTKYPYGTLTGAGNNANANAYASSAVTKGIGGYSVALNSHSTHASMFAGVIIDIPEYANTNKYKTVMNFGGFDTNGGIARVSYGSFAWADTAAITSIEVFPDYPNWATNTTLSLYGIKGA